MAGAAYSWKTQNAKVGGGGPVQVSTIVATTGDLTETIRVNGTIAAKNSAAILAPRFQGSRSDMNRGGSGGGGGRGGGGGGGPQMGGGGPMGDFSLVLLRITKAGVHVKAGDVVAEFDPQMMLQRLDDYNDTLVQQENRYKTQMASMAASKEAHDQKVRESKAAWDKAVLDEKTTPIKSDIDAAKLKLATEEAAATYKQLDYESSLVDEQQLTQIRLTQITRDQSRIELNRAQANIEKMKMKAPMDGIVVMGIANRNGEFGQVREGDQVQPGMPFMFIVDPSSMVLKRFGQPGGCRETPAGHEGRHPA